MAPLVVGVAANNIRRGEGEGRVMLEIARRLLIRGHHVFGYSALCARELFDFPNFTWTKSFRLSGPDLVEHMSVTWGLTQALKKRSHDVVCTMGPCAFSRDPTVIYFPFTQRGYREAWRKTGFKLHAYRKIHSISFGRIEARAVPRAVALMPTSSAIADQLEPLRSEAAQVEIVPGGVELKVFPKVTPQLRQLARERLGFRSHEYVIAIVGEYSTGRKGLEFLARAVAEGGKRDERILIKGPGPRINMTRSLVELGVGERVVFAPEEIEVPMIYQAADVAAIPSIYEPYSLVAIEAAATGLPIIISEIAGATEFLGDACVTVPPMKADAIRCALDSIEDDPGLAVSLGDKARKVAEGLTWESISDQASRVIENVPTWSK